MQVQTHSHTHTHTHSSFVIIQLLWTKDLHMDTVHVHDMCRAMWHIKDIGNNGEVFNVVDKGQSSEL